MAKGVHFQKVILGVPQGTVLGTVLFLVLISSIDRGTKNCYLSSFAYDTKLLMAVGDERGAKKLQQDLEAVYKWARDSNMEFNGGKFSPCQGSGCHYVLRWQIHPTNKISCAESYKNKWLGSAYIQNQCSGGAISFQHTSPVMPHPLTPGQTAGRSKRCSWGGRYMQFNKKAARKDSQSRSG
jgi:hypothetical protein